MITDTIFKEFVLIMIYRTGLLVLVSPCLLEFFSGLCSACFNDDDDERSIYKAMQLLYDLHAVVL